MKKSILNSIITIALVVIMVTVAALYAQKLLRPVETDINVNNIETFHELPKESVEVLCVGSSRMWRGMDVMRLYEQYGIGAYNYACNWQHINTTDMFIHDAFKTQKPKLIIVDASNADTPLSNVELNGEVYYTRKISWSKTKINCLRQYFGRHIDRYATYILPLAMFHNTWDSIDADNFKDDNNVHVDYWENVKNIRDDEFKYTMGYGHTDITTEVDIKDYREFEQHPFENYSVEVLDDIVTFARENGAQVLFVTFPYEGECSNLDAMAEYAARNGCGYINLFEKMDEAGIDVRKDFGDPSHLNASGARKAADYVGEYINSNYNLTDFRNIGNNLWEKDK